MRLSFFAFFIFLALGCFNQNEYKYKGDFPTWDYVNFYNAIEIGDIMTVDTSMVAYRNRIYITTDSLGDVYLNNHLIEVDDFKGVFEFVYTNPKQLEHLPVSPEKAVVFFAMNFIPKNTLKPSMTESRKSLELGELLGVAQKVVFELQEDFLKKTYNIELADVDSVQQVDIEKQFPLNLAMYTTFFEHENNGLRVKLPTDTEEEPDNVKLKRRNIWQVVVTNDNKILVRGEAVELANLRVLTKKFIGNNGLDPELSVSSKRAIISLQNDENTDYETYIGVYSELRAAYQDLWNEMAQEKFGQLFDELERDEQRQIQAEIPLVISEAESTVLGE